jgi:hypothetical protein
MVPHELTDSWFRHTFLHELSDPRVPEEVSMQVRKMTFLSIVLDHLLDGIHRQGTATGFAFESNEDVVDVREEVSALFVEVPIQCSEGDGIHEHGSSVVALRCGDVDAAAAALDILEPDGHCFADSKTADPHQQHQGAITPAGQRTKESVQVVIRKNVRHTLCLFPIQALTVLG